MNKPGASRAISHHDTQAEAQSAARGYLRNEGGGGLTTQGRDGKIRDVAVSAARRAPIGHADVEPRGLR